MEKLRRNIVWLVIASEVSHLFCCVLPTLAALLSLAVGVGLLPTAFTALHDVIHGYEIPIIIFSAVMLALGWWAYWLATRTDCHALGHDEHACHKTTDRSKVYLIIGTALFMMNFVIFITLHTSLNHQQTSHADHKDISPRI
jgi:hypothetical protein